MAFPWQMITDVAGLCVTQGVERVKPCFRKYHFAQHFRNLHPGLDCNDYEETSVVYNDTAFPRRCGFCAHRFDSRQDRIDHIAEHFKDGKCMLRTINIGSTESFKDYDIRPHYERLMNMQSKPVIARAPSLTIPELDAGTLERRFER